MKTLLMVSMGGLAALAMVSSCQTNLGRPGEPAARQVDVSGGVPIEQFLNALAVARCNYVSRCFNLATYVANDCVDTVVASGTFTYQTCTPVGSNARCSRSSAVYSVRALDQLVGKVTTGEAQYDAAHAALCIGALLAEPCLTRDLIESLPACVGVISCVGLRGPGSSDSADGGATDAGLSCWELSDQLAPFPTCTTADQCIAVANPAWPYCVSGLCAPSPCGFLSTCTAFAQAGEPCDATAPSIVSFGAATSPTGVCAPGLICQRTSVDAGMGTCILPQDVGAPCAVSSDCKPGLACAGGACEIPPSSGPCADGLCRFGVGYCDYGSGQCQPVRKQDDNCGDAINSCGPEVVCQPPNGICEPPTI